jgi:Ca2+-binding RTX toxin-like protein
MGPLNQIGMAMVYYSALTSATDLQNETLGTGGAADTVNHYASTTFNSSIDSMHLGVSAADVTVSGSAVAGSSNGTANVYIALAATLANSIDLDGWNAGSLDGHIITFDDGSVLKTNTGSATTLTGGTGADLLVAGAHGDLLQGNAGDDMLLGGAGNDQIYGGAGDDTLFGAAGSNYLVGGTGADKFMFDNATVTHDTIADFVHTTDQLWIDHNLSVSSQTDSGNDRLLVLSNNSTIRLLGEHGVDVTADIHSGVSFSVDGHNVFA